MRHLTIQDLNPAVRNRLLQEGFTPQDEAALAVPLSSLVPNKLGHAIQLARAAGVAYSTVHSWMERRKNIQEERLALLGEPTTLFATSDGHVGTREHILEVMCGR